MIGSDSKVNPRIQTIVTPRMKITANGGKDRRKTPT